MNCVSFWLIYIHIAPGSPSRGVDSLNRKCFPCIVCHLSLPACKMPLIQLYNLTPNSTAWLQLPSVIWLRRFPSDAGRAQLWTKTRRVAGRSQALPLPEVCGFCFFLLWLPKITDAEKLNACISSVGPYVKLSLNLFHVLRLSLCSQCSAGATKPATGSLA